MDTYLRATHTSQHPAGPYENTETTKQRTADPALASVNTLYNTPHTQLHTPLTRFSQEANVHRATKVLGRRITADYTHTHPYRLTTAPAKKTRKIELSTHCIHTYCGNYLAPGCPTCLPLYHVISSRLASPHASKTTCNGNPSPFTQSHAAFFVHSSSTQLL